jgi:rare lipoprotein A
MKREHPVIVRGKAPSCKVAKHHWAQIGKASWYGGKFNGRRTANGEKYDMYALTCAHRTLPLGSWVRVTNLKNKRTTLLRVNDRGPVPQRLIVDLSYAGAQRLGVRGLADVRIDEVNPSDPTLAKQMVAQLRMNDPEKMQPNDDLVAGVLAPAMLAGINR